MSKSPITQESLRAAVLRNYAAYEGIPAHYERHLVEECRYRTPGRVAAALAERGPLAGLYLDLGSGTGLVGRAAAALDLPLRFVAVDLSAAMLAAIDAPVYVERTCADALAELPYPAQTFDGAVAAGLLEHVLEPVVIFAHVARVLKPSAPFVLTFPPASGPRVAVYDPQAAALAHPPDAIFRALAETGFAVRSSTLEDAYRDGEAWVRHRLVVADRRG